MDLLPLIISAITGLAALVGSMLVARRYQQLGGGEAQNKLNAVYKALTEAFEQKIDLLREELLAKTRDFDGCKSQLGELVIKVGALEVVVDELNSRIKADQESRDVRQEERDVRQDAREARQDAS